MNLIVFGKTPALSIDIKWSADRGILLASRENRIVPEVDPGVSVTWEYLLQKSTPQIVDLEAWKDRDAERLLKEVTRILAQEFTEPAEEVFFTKYVEYCLRCSSDPMRELALIPQVWLNWIHYDPGGRPEPLGLEREPFRVDFIIMSEWRKIVMEIDGESHFMEFFGIDSAGKVSAKPSVDRYSAHLKKDRWLRREGWEVWRFSSKEVLAETDFFSFDLEMGFPFGFGAPTEEL
ncbi:MAG: hypothetical protein ACKVU1_00960 [bacterium]